jgi:cytochrome b6-f complex iron-sulfur subunit
MEGAVMKRRNFLKVAIASFASITAGSFAYALVKFLAALPSRIADTQKVVIRKSDVPSGEAKNFVYRNAPAVLINRPDKGFIVLSRTCTHLGCLVEYHHAQLLLICPCHAGTYDLEGNVLSGPPPKPLTAIPFRIEGENIVIG